MSPGLMSCCYCGSMSRQSISRLQLEFFFFQAEDGIRDIGVTGVQTCALPISLEVFRQMDPDHYKSLGKVPTGAIAKTGLYVPELKRMYIAVPKHIVRTQPYGEREIGRASCRERV